MDWLLENLEWIVGSIVALLGVVFGTSFIIKKNILSLNDIQSLQAVI